MQPRLVASSVAHYFLIALTLLLLPMKAVADAAHRNEDDGRGSSRDLFAPGEQYQECADCPRMRIIPPGQFTMTRKSAADGRGDEDPEGIPKSAPARTVRIGYALAVGIEDVTPAQYAMYARERSPAVPESCYIWNRITWIDDKHASWRRPGFRQTLHDPVVCVSWEDAQGYANWLNAKVERAGRRPQQGRYRLPTWEESEYAANADATTLYPWGGTVSRDQANYGADDCTPCRPGQSGRDAWLGTSPAGSFPANRFGLVDTVGNVWQWTLDCTRYGRTGLSTAALAPGESCTSSAARGGSWLSSPEYLRTGAYILLSRANRNQATGFRVVRTLRDEDGPAAAPSMQGPDKSKAAKSATDRADTGTQPVLSGHTFRDCTHCPQMVTLPAGEFAMGLPSSRSWDTRDVPQHQVHIDHSFAVGLYDVTRAEYEAFARDEPEATGKGCDVLDAQGHWKTGPNQNWRHPGFPQTPHDPVVCVSWHDVHAYLQWLNRRVNTRRGGRSDHAGPYRLLSEAEWEYAARAGTSTPYYWGLTASHEWANYGLEQCFPCGAEHKEHDQWLYTSPVGSFPPNRFGLFDMAGNVWQWTEDCIHYGYDGAPNNGSVWNGGECRLHVLRGGSWLDPSRFLALNIRAPWGPEHRNYANGFRVARDLDPL